MKAVRASVKEKYKDRIKKRKEVRRKRLRYEYIRETDKRHNIQKERQEIFTVVRVSVKEKYKDRIKKQKEVKIKRLKYEYMR